MDKHTKVFTKDNICEGTTVKDEAALFVNKLIANGLTIDRMDIEDDKAVIEYHLDPIDVMGEPLKSFTQYIRDVISDPTDMSDVAEYHGIIDNDKYMKIWNRLHAILIEREKMYASGCMCSFEESKIGKQICQDIIKLMTDMENEELKELKGNDQYEDKK